jgi:hypothetical protein
MMKVDTKIPALSLFGGPLHKFGARLGLVRGGTRTFKLGLALGLTFWSVLIALALLQGQAPKILSLNVIGVHVRFLVAIPLFFFCESFVFPRMAEFVSNIMDSGVVPEDQWPALAADVRRVNRMADSWLADVIFLLLTFAMPLLEIVVDLPIRTGSWKSILAHGGERLNAVNVWYLGFCLPLFRFLLLRWFWRLGLWWYFLRRVVKLKLRLVPTHSDGAGGLGYVEVVQEHFFPLALTISAVFSASFAEGIVTGAMAFEALYYLIPGILLLIAGLFIGPLFLFTAELWNCRETGLGEYMAMASRYVHAFDRRWLRDENASGESQLGTADLQSLADLTNSMNVIRDMRLVPGGRRLVLPLAVCSVLPMLPLFLLKFPVDKIASGLFRALTGL